MITNTRQKAFWILLSLCVVLFAAENLRWIYHALTVLIVYPFELDYGEGPILHQVAGLLSGLTLYSPLNEPPYTVTNYPPVFQFVSSLLAAQGFDVLMAGRSVTFMSTMLGAFLVGLLVYKVTAATNVARLRWLAALLGSMVFLVSYYVHRWGVVMRVDMLAICWEMLGLSFFLLSKRSSQKILLSVPFFLLAVFTRQSIVAAAAACFLVSFFTHRRLALQFAVTLFVGGLIVFGIAYGRTDGLFFVHHFVANKNEYHFLRAVDLIGTMFISGYGLLIIAAFIFCRRQLRSFYNAIADTESGTKQASPQSDIVATLSVFWVLAFIIMFTCGKVGSYFNYLIEFVCINSVLFALYVATFDVSLISQRKEKVFFNITLAVMLAAGVAMFYIYDYAEERQQYADNTEAFSRAAATVKSFPGLTVTEDMTFLYRAQKALYLQPFIMLELSKQGGWDQQPFLEDLKSGVVTQLVFANDVFHFDEFRKALFTPEMIGTMQQYYVLSDHIGGHYIYRHKSLYQPNGLSE